MHDTLAETMKNSLLITIFELSPLKLKLASDRYASHVRGNRRPERYFKGCQEISLWYIGRSLKKAGYQKCAIVSRETKKQYMLNSQENLHRD